MARAEEYERLRDDGTLARLLSGEPEERQRAWSQVEQMMKPLGQFPLAEATPDCEDCDGTGIVGEEKIGGILTALICACVPAGVLV